VLGCTPVVVAVVGVAVTLRSCAVQLCEFTTPFLHIRFFLSAMGMKRSKWYLYNGLVFSLSFVLVRVVLMTFMMVRVFTGPQLVSIYYWPGCAPCTIIMLCAYGFMALQYAWSVKVVTGALSFLKSDSKTK
jgi:hypothetical protein